MIRRSLLVFVVLLVLYALYVAFLKPELNTVQKRSPINRYILPPAWRSRCRFNCPFPPLGSDFNTEPLIKRLSARRFIPQFILPNDSGDVFAEGATSATSSRVK